MKLKVPYYSQKIDVKDSEWKDRACGITCLKMVLNFYGKGAPALDELIELGVESGAYGKSGWIHQGLVDVADRFGLTIESREFKSGDESESLREEGVRQIIKSLKEGVPVLVSVVKKFKYSDKFHMVVLVGTEGDEENPEGFYYHDPDADAEKEGENLFVSIEMFRKHWRRMAIFVKRFD